MMMLKEEEVNFVEAVRALRLKQPDSNLKSLVNDLRAQHPAAGTREVRVALKALRLELEKPVTKTKVAVSAPLALRLGVGQCAVCSSELPLDIHGLGDNSRMAFCCGAMRCVPCNKRLVNKRPLPSSCEHCSATPHPAFLTGRQATSRLSQLVERGDVNAQFALGVMHRDGSNGLRINGKKATHLLEQATEQGNADACIRLADMLLGSGGATPGVRLDIPRGVHLMSCAAEAGHPLAMYNMGFIYDRGDDVERDAASAVRWWHLAADAGNMDAQRELGMGLYSGDEGIPQYVLTLFLRNRSTRGRTGKSGIRTSAR